MVEISQTELHLPEEDVRHLREVLATASEMDRATFRRTCIAMFDGPDALGLQKVRGELEEIAKASRRLIERIFTGRQPGTELWLSQAEIKLVLDVLERHSRLEHSDVVAEVAAAGLFERPTNEREQINLIRRHGGRSAVVLRHIRLQIMPETQSIQEVELVRLSIAFGRRQRAEAPRPDQVNLRDFFRRSFAPLRLADRPGRGRFYLDAIAWLARVLNRDPILRDVDASNLEALERLVFEHGFGPSLARSIRVCLLALARHAWRIGLLSDYQSVRPARKPPERPTFAHTPPRDDTLSAAFERQLRPELARDRHRNTINAHAAAIHQFDLFLGRYATAADVAGDTLRAFRGHLLSAGRAESLFELYAQRLRAVARILEPAAFADRRHRIKPLPAAAEGTVREFFESTYRPERLTGATPDYVEECRRTLRLLFEFLGNRDPLLTELSSAMTSDFMAWLIARPSSKRTAQLITVNGHRARLFAIWRLAVERGRIAQDPQVKKLPVALDTPDAWSEEETTRIIHAPFGIRWRRDIAGIPAADYFHAMLLVAYWTALRKGSLLKLRRDWVDLKTGWIAVGGSAMKNKRGKRLRLGSDAIAALERIWLPERELLFPWPHDPTHLGNAIRRIITAAEVSPSAMRGRTLLHKMRRTVATITTVKRGLATACELLGHSGTEVTKRYVDPSKVAGQDATLFLPVLGRAREGAGDDAQLGAPPAGSPFSARPDPLAGNRDRHQVPLDEARALLESGHAIASAMTARVALERWLRGLSKQSGCAPSGGASPGLKAQARALHSQGRLDGAALEGITLAARKLNRAAHGRHMDPRHMAQILAMLERIMYYF
jgi:integrase